MLDKSSVKLSVGINQYLFIEFLKRYITEDWVLTEPSIYIHWILQRNISMYSHW